VKTAIAKTSSHAARRKKFLGVRGSGLADWAEIVHVNLVVTDMAVIEPTDEGLCSMNSLLGPQSRLCGKRPRLT
jgi:hypothetical protein